MMTLILLVPLTGSISAGGATARLCREGVAPVGSTRPAARPRGAGLFVHNCVLLRKGAPAGAARELFYSNFIYAAVFGWLFSIARALSGRDRPEAEALRT